MTEFWIQGNDKYMLNDLSDIINDNVKAYLLGAIGNSALFFAKNNGFKERQSWMLPDLSVPRKTTNGPI